MRVPKFLAAAAAGLALCIATAPAAGADPKKGELLSLECDVLGSLDVVVFSNGPWSPGLVVGTNQVGIPYHLHIEGTFTPADGSEPESFVEDHEKPAPRNGRLDHCTFHQEGSDETGTFVIDGEVSISYTPAK